MTLGQILNIHGTATWVSILGDPILVLGRGLSEGTVNVYRFEESRTATFSQDTECEQVIDDPFMRSE